MLSTEQGSLAPSAANSHYNTLAGSHSPVLYARRRLRVQDWISSAWVDLFDGFVDVPNASGHRVTLECRDRYRQVIDKFLEVPLQEDGDRYAITPQLPLEDLIQYILDNHVNVHVSPAWTLNTIGDPEWMVGPYKLEEGSVGERIQEAAAKRG
jgi:hypothetical protein